MDIFCIRGGTPLHGRIALHGAKNAALPLLAATLATGARCELHDCPDISDVTAACAILRHLGCAVEQHGGIVAVDAGSACRSDIPAELMRKMRAAVLFLGPLLARFGTAELSLPGGCVLGARPIDLHLRGLRRMGAEITLDGEHISARTDGLHGCTVALPLPSVGATENLILAALGCRGTLTLCNAAREPEIADLQCYLRKLGADISGAGTSTVTVGGFRPRPFVEHTIMPDRIVAATILCAAAACGGEVELQDVDPAHFSTVLDSLSEAGCAIITAASAVRLTSDGQLTAPRPVVTQPYPGFPTDAQPPLMAACLRAKGTTVFTENIFTNRYRHAEEFRRLGAAVSIEGRVAYVTGVERLTGAPLTASDLRGGAAMLVAGLCAEGATELFDDGDIDRGYDRFDACLSALGADVRCAAPR